MQTDIFKTADLGGNAENGHGLAEHAMTHVPAAGMPAAEVPQTSVAA